MAHLKRLTKREIGLKQRPWITPDILRKMKERDKFYNKYANERDKNSSYKK